MSREKWSWVFEINNCPMTMEDGYGSNKSPHQPGKIGLVVGGLPVIRHRSEFHSEPKICVIPEFLTFYS